MQLVPFFCSYQQHHPHISHHIRVPNMKKYFRNKPSREQSMKMARLKNQFRGGPCFLQHWVWCGWSPWHANFPTNPGELSKVVSLDLWTRKQKNKDSKIHTNTLQYLLKHKTWKPGYHWLPGYLPQPYEKLRGSKSRKAKNDFQETGTVTQMGQTQWLMPLWKICRAGESWWFRMGKNIQFLYTRLLFRMLELILLVTSEKTQNRCD